MPQAKSNFGNKGLAWLVCSFLSTPLLCSWYAVKIRRVGEARKKKRERQKKKNPPTTKENYGLSAYHFVGPSPSCQFPFFPILVTGKVDSQRVNAMYPAGVGGRCSEALSERDRCLDSSSALEINLHFPKLDPRRCPREVALRLLSHLT